MIVHIVLLRIRSNVLMKDVEKVFTAFGALRQKIPGITGYSWGAYASPEGLNRGFTHAFCMGFQSVALRDAYLAHPEHQKVVNLAMGVIEGGVDGVLTFDYAA